MKIISKPLPGDFFQTEPMLVNLIPGDGNLTDHLRLNIQETVSFLSALPADKLLYSYAPGKWSIAEIIIHMIDMERIYGYRMLCIARGDETPLPGFDDAAYVSNAGVNNRDTASLLAEMMAVREATIQLLDGFTVEALDRKGSVKGQQVSVRALAWHIAGHELHHVNIIQTRYL